MRPKTMTRPSAHPAPDSFELLDDSDPQRVKLCFRGPYQETEVAWQATFTTLAALARDEGGPPAGRNFIEIRGEPPAPQLLVGLAISAFDRPTILKTVMMIRRYKRLRPGRHSFGTGENSTT